MIFLDGNSSSLMGILVGSRERGRRVPVAYHYAISNECAQHDCEMTLPRCREAARGMYNSDTSVSRTGIE